MSDVDSLKSSVSNGKTLVANAITGKGVATSPSDTFATMANNINQIPQAIVVTFHVQLDGSGNYTTPIIGFSPQAIYWYAYNGNNVSSAHLQIWNKTSKIVDSLDYRTSSPDRTTTFVSSYAEFEVTNSSHPDYYITNGVMVSAGSWYHEYATCDIGVVG